MRIVVLGAAGNFGSRICRRLESEPSVQIIRAGRRPRVGVSDPDTHHALDLNAPDFTSRLRSLRPDLVIHCAGPFQGQDYRVAEAALSCGAHYLDLADGREFVAGFSTRLDACARRAGRVAITGASTLPGLSSAVVDHLTTGLTRIDAIDIVIAPAQRAPRGMATLEGVFSYAGRGFPVWERGAWRIAHGWQELRRVRLPFGTRLAAVCDVPDLALFPDRYAGVRSVSFHAALEVPLQHLALWCIAGLHRMGVSLPLRSWCRALDRAGRWMDRFGSELGGMQVCISGSDAAGRARRSTWQVVADDNYGPEIPCMAALLTVTMLARRDPLPPGARPCMGFLTLANFAPEFARWGMQTRITHSPA